MIINETSKYLKDYKQKIQRKNKDQEKRRIEDIKTLIVSSDNLKLLLENPYSKIYDIEQKKGNLKEIFTADINRKMRLMMKPDGIYPYNREIIVEIGFIGIDDSHYGEG
jgi:plasmid maintenance system killer protein